MAASAASGVRPSNASATNSGRPRAARSAVLHRRVDVRVAHPLLELQYRHARVTDDLRAERVGKTKLGPKFASRRTSKDDKSPAMQGFSDAGGGTRTPDTRIMIGAL